MEATLCVSVFVFLGGMSRVSCPAALLPALRVLLVVC